MGEFENKLVKGYEKIYKKALDKLLESDCFIWEDDPLMIDKPCISFEIQSKNAGAKGRNLNILIHCTTPQKYHNQSCKGCAYIKGVPLAERNFYNTMDKISN